MYRNLHLMMILGLIVGHIASGELHGQTTKPNAVAPKVKAAGNLTHAELEARAKSGDADALLQLGLRYEFGIGAGLIQTMAQGYYVEASTRGNLTAKAICKLRGISVKMNRDGAFADLSLLGLDGTNPVASRMLGVCYQFGYGCAKDEAKAFNCYQLALKCGDSCAYLNLANCHFEGAGCAKDVNKGIECLEKASLKGIRLASLMLDDRRRREQQDVAKTPGALEKPNSSQQTLTETPMRPSSSNEGNEIGLEKVESIEENIKNPVFRKHYQVLVEGVTAADGSVKQVVCLVNRTKFNLQVTGSLEHEYTLHSDAYDTVDAVGPRRVPESSETKSDLHYPINRKINGASSRGEEVVVLYQNDMKAMVPIMPNVARLTVKVLDDDESIIRAYELGDRSHKTLQAAFAAEQIKADAGDKISQFKVAKIYRNGDFGKTDLEMFDRYIRLSAAQNYAPAQAELADYLLSSASSNRLKIGFFSFKVNEDGDGLGTDRRSAYTNGSVPVDKMREALNLLLSAAAAGDSKAQLLLGFCCDYILSDGMKADLDKAFFWYQKSAQQGNREAMAQLGNLFRCGFTHENKNRVDIRQANEWYKKAADLGHALSDLRLQDGSKDSTGGDAAK